MTPDQQLRVEQLVGAHLDGTLDADQVAELAALLAADGEARKTFARSVALDTVLPQVAGKMRRPRRHAGSPSAPQRWWLWSGLAAAALLLVAVGLWPAHHGPSLDGGTGAVVLRAGSELDAAAAGPLRDADVVRAHGAVAVRWADEGTVMDLADGGVLELTTVGPGKTVSLKSGVVTIAAGHQTGGRTLTVRSGRLAVAVVGTRFTVASTADSSSVEVSEGAVTVDDGLSRHTVARGQLAVIGATGGLQIGSSVAIPHPGARLDAAAWQADKGTGWIGTVRGTDLVATVETTAERVADPTRLDGYARLLPDLAITADVTLTRPGTLAIFIVCRRPDGSDWLGNYTVQEDLPAGRHQRIWSTADLRVEKGAPVSAAFGARVVDVAVCAWSQPVGLVVHRVAVGNPGAAALKP